MPDALRQSTHGERAHRPVVVVVGEGEGARLLAEHAADLGVHVRRAALADLGEQTLAGASGALVAADGYPLTATVLPPASRAALTALCRKGGRVYVEFAVPEDAEAGASPSPHVLRSERLVVMSRSALTGDLQRGRLLESHEASVVAPGNPLDHHDDDFTTVLAAYARVAGVHDAVLGIPADTRPAVLRTRCGAGVLVHATTALSNHVRGRYKPAAAWSALVSSVVAFVVHGDAARPALSVRERPRPDEPGGGRGGPVGWREMLDRAAGWYRHSGVLLGAGDGSDGVAEGLVSRIGPDGRQELRRQPRADCFIETADALDRYSAIAGDPALGEVARTLADAVVGTMQVRGHGYRTGRWEPRGAWTGRLPTSQYVFPDDDGVVTTHALLLGARWQDERAVEAGLRAAEALTRTASPTTGAQPPMSVARLARSGWAHYRERPVPNRFASSPHWQSGPQTALLTAYSLSGEQRYLDVALASLRTVLAAFPHTGVVTSRTEELARLLLPLALAFEATGESDLRAALERVAAQLLELQDPASGAVREWDGHHPARNADYGTRENSVFQRNGDPVTDQLYTTGFLATNLWAAYRATGMAEFERLHTGLLDYLSAIQIRSAEPSLDGTWLRAYDFATGEYHGSNADVAWGPYAVETGWTVAPIMVGAAMRLTDEPFWPAPGELPRERRALGARLGAQVRAELDAVAEACPVEPAAPAHTRRLHLGFDSAELTRGARGEAVGAPQWHPDGIVGGCLALGVAEPGADGVPSHLELAAPEPLDEGPFTVSLWVRAEPASLAAPSAGVFTCGEYGLWLREGRVVAQVACADDVVELRSAVDVAARSWAHVAITYDGVMLRLWHNGHVVADSAAGRPSPAGPPGAPLLVGAGRRVLDGREVLEPFTGRLDEVRVDSALEEPDMGELELWRSVC